MKYLITLCCLFSMTILPAAGQEWLSDGRMQWKSSGPLVAPEVRPDDPCYSVKDPTVVFYGGKFHVFATIRSEKRTHQIEYLAFADWNDAGKAERHVLNMQSGYFCAPQVFYFTTLDGRMWREETPLAQFPRGWSEPKLALDADIFEASHTYKIKGQEKYLTVVEAQNGPAWRYYKAYLADRLDGPWTPLADSHEKNFAGKNNVTFPTGEPWADSISHVELIRSGFDEKLEIDPNHLRLVYQGVLDRNTSGIPYGQIPWRLGVLEK